jgi:ABC-type sugar transport system substrate-binding protein
MFTWKPAAILPFPQGDALACEASHREVCVRLGAKAIATFSALLLAVSTAGAKPAKVRVGVVLKSLDNPFFVTMYEGVRSETVRRGASSSVRAATGNANPAGQARLVRELVAEGKDCYVVNPITSSNLIAPLRGVKRPIVNVDSPIDAAAAKRAGVHVETFIGTNDFAAGKAAAATMVSLLPGGGTIALVGGTADSVNSLRRLSGFEHGIRGTRLRLIARVDADYARDEAEVAADGILRAHPGLAGFFVVNDEMALGVEVAVRSAGKAGTVAIIGVDGTSEVLAAVRDGSISATVSQYPYVMGQMAIEACVAANRGARLPARVDSPIAVVTKSNVARASAAFPQPFRGYSDPFAKILRKPR